MAQADVAIVGAGPAGAAAACHFARAGFRVALIDQRRFPRDKVCGDFVGPSGLSELDRLGVSLQPPLRDANKIRRGAFYLNGGKVVGRPFPHVNGLRDHGLCIPRILLDDAIVQAAVASGASLIEGSRVTGYETDTDGVSLFHQGTGGQRCLRTRLLIGADGSASLVSRILRGAQPPRRDRIIAVRGYFDGVSGAADQGDLYVNTSSLPGYYWLFPTGTSSANVGVGMLLDAWPPSKQQLGQLFDDLIKSDPAIRLRLSDAKIQGKIVGWPLSTFNPQLPIVGNRVALIGDAAGFINPLTGEGIQYALRSARWCLESLCDALSTDRLSAADLRPYTSRVCGELRYDMALSRFIIDLVRNRLLNPVWLSTLDVIARRAAFDSEYYHAAAGVFAGVASAKNILTPPFVWRTMKSATIYALHGPQRLWKTSRTLTNAGVSMVKHAMKHPVAALDWGVQCALSALELATQMAISALPRGSQSHQR